jgi:hypothetical protein
MCNGVVMLFTSPHPHVSAPGVNKIWMKFGIGINTQSCHVNLMSVYY